MSMAKICGRGLINTQVLMNAISADVVVALRGVSCRNVTEITFTDFFLFFGVKREKVQESFLVGKGGITTTVLLFATHPSIEYTTALHCCRERQEGEQE